jgi:hypothetical protein
MAPDQTKVVSIAADLLIIVIGIACLGWITDDFQAVLLETARRLEISERQPALPDVRVEDQFGAADDHELRRPA